MRIREIKVLPVERRIRLKVEMPDPDRALTSHSPHIAPELFRLIPRLSLHTCHNPKGLTFRQECRKTEIPHLFEHLIIELQLQAQQNAADILRGETEWNWIENPRGHYHVFVEYESKLLVFGAIRLAERIMRRLDARKIEGMDIEAELAHLRHLALLDRIAATEPKSIRHSSPVLTARRRVRHDENRADGVFAGTARMVEAAYAPVQVG